MQSREVLMPNFKYLNTFQSHSWTRDHITRTLIRDFLSKKVFDTLSSVLQEILEVFPAGTENKSV